MFKSERQILITGCYRAGTEYITQLIGNHPDIRATMYVVNYLRYCLNRYGPVDKTQNYTELVFDAASRIRRRWNRQLDPHAVIDHCESHEKVTDALLYDAMMSELFIDDQTPIWAEKNQLVWSKIPDFLEMFPNGQVVHIFRDPRSILASFREFTYTEAPKYLSAVFNTLDSMRRGLDYADRYSPDRYTQLKYEQIVRNPEKTMEGLFDRLRLSANHQLLSSEGWTGPRGNPWRSNSAFDSDESFDKNAALERWKTNLDDWEIALCEAINADAMRAYNYEPADPQIPWREFIRPLFEDELLKDLFERWVTTGRGKEAFPTDPLDADNWTENATA